MLSDPALGRVFTLKLTLVLTLLSGLNESLITVISGPNWLIITMHIGPCCETRKVARLATLLSSSLAGEASGLVVINAVIQSLMPRCRISPSLPRTVILAMCHGYTATRVRHRANRHAGWPVPYWVVLHGA